MITLAQGELAGHLTGGMAGLSSADWFTPTSDGLGLRDVRIAIKTEDDALVLMRYQGRTRLMPNQASTAFAAPSGRCSAFTRGR